jgi:hypothetical protein
VVNNPGNIFQPLHLNNAFWDDGSYATAIVSNVLVPEHPNLLVDHGIHYDPMTETFLQRLGAWPNEPYSRADHSPGISSNGIRLDADATFRSSSLIDATPLRGVILRQEYTVKAFSCNSALRRYYPVLLLSLPRATGADDVFNHSWWPTDDPPPATTVTWFSTIGGESCSLNTGATLTILCSSGCGVCQCTLTNALGQDLGFVYPYASINTAGYCEITNPDGTPPTPIFGKGCSAPNCQICEIP